MIRAEPAGTRYQLKDFKYNSHYWILKLLSEAKQPLRILDIGTADGYLGAILKGQGHYMVGVENDEALAVKARCHYDQFYIADVEEFDFPFDDEFDYILFADTLEHLKRPAEVLRRALPVLKNTGEAVVSVPNVANFLIRLSLLAGRFNYTERGILDKTHLRFFTLRTVAELLESCGCRVIEVIATPAPIQLILPFTRQPLFNVLHEIHFGLTRMWKQMFGYQFVIRVKRAVALAST
jgi:SAM-dependent methyltransferase